MLLSYQRTLLSLGALGEGPFTGHSQLCLEIQGCCAPWAARLLPKGLRLSAMKDDLETDGKSPGTPADVQLAGQLGDCSDGAAEGEQMWPLQAVFSCSVSVFESVAGLLPWTYTEHVHADATYTIESYDVLTQPDLLEFLQVQDLVQVRAASSAESFDEAVSLHVEKAAGFELSEFTGSAMISCRNFLYNLRRTERGSGETSPDCGKRLLREEFGNNLAPQKSQLCRAWLLLQASEEHFRDSRGMTERFLKRFVTVATKIRRSRCPRTIC
eukprot:s1253_g18.t1